MVNEKGRPKKLRNKEWGMTSFYIPDSFRDIWKKLSIIADKNKIEEFKEYCIEVEGEDLDTKGQGIRGLYIRWVLTKHVIENIELLNKK